MSQPATSTDDRMTMPTTPVRVGIIGCGDIAKKAYVPACKRFPGLELVACADRDVARAEGLARDAGLPAGTSVAALLADPAIELVINLTIPQAHAEVNRACLAAGKHVYCEKPFGIDRDEGRAVLVEAAKRGLLVGSAPDTVLGSAVQTARHYIDAGLVGRIIGGSCHMLCGAPEAWHPNPAFLYQRGAGPLFDMGAYYLHTLITLIGPVRRVAAAAATTWTSRTIGSQPLRGQAFAVEVPTHVCALLTFHSGAIVNVTLSFDVRGTSTLPNMELFGAEGSIQIPDPNFCEGDVRINRRDVHAWTTYQPTHGYRTGSRGVGVADMARAIRSGRTHRANGELAMHALDIMAAIAEAAAGAGQVDIATTCERPAAMPLGLSDGEID